MEARKPQSRLGLTGIKLRRFTPSPPGPAEINAVPRQPLIHTPRPIPARQSWDAPNLLLSTLAVADAMPFMSLDFGIRQPVWRQRDESFSTQLPELHSRPFASVDWLPQPRVITRPSSDAPNLLASTLGEPPVPTPFNQLDWSLQPRSGIRKDFEPQNLLAYFNYDYGTPFSAHDWPVRQGLLLRKDTPEANLTALRTAVAVTPTIFRAPLIHYRQALAPRQDFLAPNLALSTLAPVLVTPFVSCDWSVRSSPVARPHFAHPNMMAMMTHDYGMPFSMHDWSTQLRLGRRADFIAPNTLEMLASVPPAAMPFSLTDWPQRASVRAPRPVLFVRDYQSSPAPFTFHDWTLRPRAHTRKDFEQQNLIAYLNYNYGTPFSMHEWPVRPRQHSRQESSEQNLIALRTFVAASPFAQLDWAYPEFRYMPKPHWDVDLLPHLLQTVHVKPFCLHDWTVRDRVRQPAREQMWNYSLAMAMFQYPDLANAVRVLLHVSPEQPRELAVTPTADHPLRVSGRVNRDLTV